MSLAKQKSDIDGVDELKRLVEENKTNLSAQLALIEQLVRLGYREQAGDRVEWLLLQHPNSAPLHYWRALTRYRSGYLEGARDSILRYFGLLPLADIQGSDPIFERALRMLVEFERRLRKIESEKKEP